MVMMKSLLPSNLLSGVAAGAGFFSRSPPKVGRGRTVGSVDAPPVAPGTLSVVEPRGSVEADPPGGPLEGVALASDAFAPGAPVPVFGVETLLPGIGTLIGSRFGVEPPDGFP